MSITKSIICIFILNFCFTIVQSQEQFLWKKDKFNSTGGIFLDPTHGLVNPNSWDINLIGIDAFIQNNYTYIPRQSFENILRESPIKFGYSNESSYYLTSNLDILAPSISFKFKAYDREIALGLFTRVRSMVSGYNIDSGFNYNNFNNVDELELFQLGKATLTGMNWSEIGFNIATKINNDTDKQWQLGLNLKYLLGFDSFYFKNKEPLGVILTDDFIDISGYDIEVGLGSGYDFNDKAYNMKPQGTGLGADIGISYVKNKYHRIPANKYLYDYKWNFTILDLGVIRFNGEKHIFKGNNVLDILDSENENIKNPYQLFKSLSTKVYSDSLASKTGNNFVIGLPTAISFSYQKPFSETQYISFLISQRVPVQKYALKRANNISIGYFVNKYAIGYGASFSMYEYKIPQFGGYLRLGPLYVGSDNIFPILFKQKRLQSADLYFGLKIYPFWDSEEKKKDRQPCCY